MTQFAYVKNGGARASATAYTAIQAISSTTMTTANYYDSIDDAHTYNTLVAGDYVLCFDAHDKNYGTTKTLTLVDGVNYISVDETDGSAFKAGAIEQATGGVYDLTLDAADGSELYLSGLYFIAGDDIIVISPNSKYTFEDGGLELAGANEADRIAIGQQDGTIVNIINSTLTFGTANQRMSGSGTAVINLKGVTTVGAPDPLVANFGAGGVILNINDSDLSTVTGSIVEFTGVASDQTIANITRTTIGSASLVSAEPYYPGQQINTYSINKGTGNDTYHYFEHHRYEGKIIESTTVYRILGATYDSINHFSAEVQTNSNVIPYSQPLKYKLAEIEIDLTTSKTLTAHITQQDGSFFPANLTDHECWIEVTYPDATYNTLGKTVSSQTTGILETPVDLSLSNQAWTVPSGYVTKQLMSAVVPASIAKAPVTVHLCVAKDITVADGNGASAIEMFACPKLEIS